MTTKYFTRKAKLRNEKQEEWEPVELNRENWWFVQFNATIATAFGYYGISNPPAVYVEDKQYSKEDIPEVNIYVVRPPIRKPKDFDKFLKVKFYIESELKRQAEANSDEEKIIYKIELI